MSFKAMQASIRAEAVTRKVSSRLWQRSVNDLTLWKGGPAEKTLVLRSKL
jgi:hypothetical protein